VTDKLVAGLAKVFGVVFAVFAEDNPLVVKVDKP
jgi:hypothetical protein